MNVSELGPNDACFLKRARVGKCDEVIKYSAPMFSSFSQWFAPNLCNNSDQTRFCHSLTFAMSLGKVENLGLRPRFSTLLSGRCKC